NTGGTLLKWSASASQSWVSLGATSGTLAPGEQFTVVVSINAIANGFSAGGSPYADTVIFTDTITGAATSRSVFLTVLPAISWTVAAIDTGNDREGVGYFPAVAFDSLGRTHLSYLFWSGGLRYVTDGGGAWKLATVDQTGGVTYLSANSLALDADGHAHIAYRDSSNGTLKHTTNASDAWVATIVDNSGDVGSYASLAIDRNGKAHISYFDSSNGHLKYATNASGSWQVVTIDSSSAVGYGTSLAVDQNGH